MRPPEWLPDTQRPRRPEHGPRRALIERLVQPLARSLHVEAGGGLVLPACDDIPGFSAEVWVESGDLAGAEAILRQHRDHSEGAAPAEYQTENPCS